MLFLYKIPLSVLQTEDYLPMFDSLRSSLGALVNTGIRCLMLVMSVVVVIRIISRFVFLPNMQDMTGPSGLSTNVHMDANSDVGSTMEGGFLPKGHYPAARGLDVEFKLFNKQSAWYRRK